MDDDITNKAKPSISAASSAFHYLFKVVLVGDTGVGKSCLLVRFADDEFNDKMIATIGVDFRTRTIPVLKCSKKAKLQIWDSAGQERFRCLTSSYYRGAHAVAVVFDLSSFASISAVCDSWLDEIDLHCSPSVKRILIGNKCDLMDSRQVSEQHALQVAEQFGMSYIETSAKTCHNVHQAFETIVHDILTESIIGTSDGHGDDDQQTIQLPENIEQSQRQRQRHTNKKKCC